MFVQSWSKLLCVSLKKSYLQEGTSTIPPASNILSALSRSRETCMHESTPVGQTQQFSSAKIWTRLLSALLCAADIKFTMVLVFVRREILNFAKSPAPLRRNAEVCVLTNVRIVLCKRPGIHFYRAQKEALVMNVYRESLRERFWQFRRPCGIVVATCVSFMFSRKLNLRRLGIEKRCKRSSP